TTVHPQLIHAMRRQPAFVALRERLPAASETVSLAGLAGSSEALLIAALADAEPNRLWAYVARTPGEADALEADLQTLVGGERVAFYPQRESLPYEAAEPHVEIGGLRVEALEAVLGGRAHILVTTLRAVQERSDIPSELAELRLTIRTGEKVRPRELTERLDAMGFERTALVEGVGEYAVRGGILDLFGFGAPDPVRVEFWGDEVASLRGFDILDQRSTREFERVDVLPVDLRATVAGRGDVARRSLLEVLPREAVLLLPEEEAVGEELGRTWREVLHLHEAAVKRGQTPEPAERLFLPPADALATLSAFGRLRRAHVAHADIFFEVRPTEDIGRDMDRLSGILRAGAARGEDTLILCDNAGQLERLEEILGGAGALPPRTTLALGSVHEGFVLDGAEPPVRVLTDHEIFSRARRLRRARRFRGAVALESLSQLQPGDYVVHLDHGIGRFRGMEKVEVGGVEIESLAIEYAGGEVLRLPVYRLDLIERWVPDREESDPPPVHK
ncbi:MAG: CarD family transcriptional regulator, partial [Longimicrobiales bacterium]